MIGSEWLAARGLPVVEGDSINAMVVSGVTCEAARNRLTNRWREQVERFPLMREWIPLDLYIQRHLSLVMRTGVLARYEGDK